ncbi:hypothetical protein GQ457_07G042070 [Hibiscus cannabinus]
MNDVGEVVNSDPEVNSYLKVVFVPNYNVSVAEMLIPGSELSQHISTAGMEASGTSNMKFALNEEIGRKISFFSVQELMKSLGCARTEKMDCSNPILGDYFLVGHDFPDYLDAQARVDEAYKDRKRWLKMSILSTAGCGKFSSDRTIAQTLQTDVPNPYPPPLLLNSLAGTKSRQLNLPIQIPFPFIQP